MKTYNEYREMTERALIPALSSIGNIPEPLLSSMTYSLKAGGKRLRPVLLLSSCEIAGGSAERALPFACALEMIHTYSLIHDDLPAMDNDDLRRGKPTNHKVFGENIAILAGDGLLNAAAEVMAEAAAKAGDMRTVRAMLCVLRHAGATGMIAGQNADVTSEKETPTTDKVRYIHEHKTADLLQAAVEAGLILGGADWKAVEAGSAYALHLGMAFQMTDDLLDVTGSSAELGKTTGKDQEQNKMTWVSLRGTEGTEEDVRNEIALAEAALSQLPWPADVLRDIARSIPGRSK